jgi:hypothetical protein
MDNINDDLIMMNIFNRSLFKRSSKEELIKAIDYYTSIEDYEKCIVLKDLYDIEYYTDDIQTKDLDTLDQIVNDFKDSLDDFVELSSLLKEINDDTIINDIDDTTDEIIYGLLKSEKLRYKFLERLYNDVKDLEIPDIKDDNHKDMFIKYRDKSLNNLKKMIETKTHL